MTMASPPAGGPPAPSPGGGGPPVPKPIEAKTGIASSLGRKIGPLPAWGWAILIAGGVIGYRMLKGGGRSGSSSGQVDQQLIPVSTMSPDTAAGAGSGFLNDLTVALDRMAGQQSAILDAIKAGAEGAAGAVGATGAPGTAGTPGAAGSSGDSTPSTSTPTAYKPTPISAKPTAGLVAAVKAATPAAAKAAAAPVTVVAKKTAFNPASYMSSKFPAAKVAAAIRKVQPKRPVPPAHPLVGAGGFRESL